MPERDKPLKILLVDDNRDDRRMATRAIRKEFEHARIQEVGTAEQFERALETPDWSLAITDYQLKWSCGLTVFSMLRRSFRDLPVIMLTGSGSEQIAVEALKNGVNDYVLKGDKHLKLIGATIRNVLRTAEVERNRRQEEEKYRHLLENLQDGVVLTEGGVVQHANSAAARIWGYGSPEDMVGLPTWEMASGEWKEVIRERAAWQAARKEVADLFEFPARRADGSVFYCEARVTSVPGESGMLSMVILRDSTERRKIEEQIRHVQKMEAIGELAGGVAHDFNNMLTAIVGYGGLLHMRMPEGDPLRTSVEQILSAAEKAAGLTQSLMTLSRKQAAGLRKVNLNAIVRRMERFLSRAIGEDVALKTRYADRDLIVRAETSQIELVLMNLATHARDAMPDGGTLAVTTECVELEEPFITFHGYGAPGRYARISVADTGIGMDEKAKERIFEPFFAAQELGRGTEWGLPIVYGIVRQHSGYVTVESMPAGGTVFGVYLPVVPRAIQDREAIDPVAIPRGTETILVAEDDPEVRRLTRNILEEFGYRVIEAVDGEDALQKFEARKEEIQFLLLDVIMPKKSGREVYDAVRRERPDVKALFTSGYPEDVIRKKGILEQGLSFCQKPLSVHGLLRKVRDVLDGG